MFNESMGMMAVSSHRLRLKKIEFSLFSNSTMSTKIYINIEKIFHTLTGMYACTRLLNIGEFSFFIRVSFHFSCSIQMDFPFSHINIYYHMYRQLLWLLPSTISKSSLNFPKNSVQKENFLYCYSKQIVDVWKCNICGCMMCVFEESAFLYIFS